MRAIVLASTALALVSSPALAAEPSITVVNGQPTTEGHDAVVQLKRHGTLNAFPSTIIVYTTDGTAKEPTDYRATGQVLTADPIVRGALDPSQLTRALSPERHLGSAAAFVTAVLDRHRKGQAIK